MSKTGAREHLRRLPSVDALLQTEAIRDAVERYPRRLVLESIRHTLDSVRKRLLEDHEAFHERDLDVSGLIESIMERLDALSSFTLRDAVNATGIIIHTNLGRSLLPREAIERLQLICGEYNNLEYDLETGERGSRYVHAESILRELTGAESALVVNNNAGAVFLVLNTLAMGREVVISRGQLVEIGGSFRIPDVMNSSGAMLKEIGCTNRTHPRDYESAINERTALLMKVHTSNYRITGFTAEVSLEDMVAIGRDRGIPVIEDLGSGSFIDLSRFGLPGEPTVQDTIRKGADIVTFSGDKLLGGPQAGIILGKKDLVERCKKNPITRALRVDKMSLAALEATLRLYRDERVALERIPTLRMLVTPSGVLKERAEALASLIRVNDAGNLLHTEVKTGFSQVGGGSLPTLNLPTYVVAVGGSGIAAQGIEKCLRKNEPPIIGRIESDHFLLDVRTLLPEHFEVIQTAFCRFIEALQGGTA